MAEETKTADLFTHWMKLWDALSTSSSSRGAADFLQFSASAFALQATARESTRQYGLKDNRLIIHKMNIRESTSSVSTITKQRNGQVPIHCFYMRFACRTAINRSDEGSLPVES